MVAVSCRSTGRLSRQQGESDGSRQWSGQLDQVAEAIRDMLFSGKFNSMFSLLFGIGFTIQFAHLEQQDPAGATGIYLRRLAVLAVLGLIHGAIFWPDGCAGRSKFRSWRPRFAHVCGSRWPSAYCAARRSR